MKETTACSRELGFELRRRREVTGLSATELGERLGWSHSKVSRLETGVRGAAETDVVQYLAFLGCSFREIRGLRALCRDASRDLGYWLGSPMSLGFHEARAEVCVSYHPETIPALLSVGDDSPLGTSPVRTFLLHERLLRGPVGLEQVLKLLLVADVPSVVIRVVPGGEIFGGGFRVLEFGGHAPLVFVEGEHVGLFLEAQDYVSGYYALASRIAQTALDGDQTRDLLVELAAYAQVSNS